MADFLSECSACQSRKILDPKGYDADGDFRVADIVSYFKEDIPVMKRNFLHGANHEPKLCGLCVSLKAKLEAPKKQVASPLVAVDDKASCPSCNKGLGEKAMTHAMKLAIRELMKTTFPDSEDDSEDDSEGVGGPRLCSICMALLKRV